MTGTKGLEPISSAESVRCSILLSYVPTLIILLGV